MFGQVVTVVVCLLVAVGSSHAFVFGRSDRVAHSEGREVEDSCLAHADEGSCQFYSCFENRLPCGRNWYMLRHGLFYCNKMNRMMDSFSEQAQNFLQDSQRCLMQNLKDIYREDMLSCHTLEHQAVDAISDCFIDNGFCAALRGNFAKFFQIYEPQDLFSTGAGKVWREILSLATQCGGEALETITSGAGRTLTEAMADIAGSIRNRISNIFDL